MTQVDDFWVSVQKASKSTQHRSTSLFPCFDALFQYAAYISLNILLDKENVLIDNESFSVTKNKWNDIGGKWMELEIIMVGQISRI